MTTIFTEPITRTPAREASGLFVWTFGVLLPAAAIAVEASTGVCREFIDPMPTAWHLALLIAVPVCNILAWLGLKSDAAEHSRWFAAMSGFSGAIALFYAILFMPIAPMAVIGLIVVLPVLALAPALAFWTALRLMRDWRGFAGWRPVGMGAAAGAAALVLAASPAIGARIGAGMTRSDLSWVRETGFYLLGLDGVRDELLEACYARATGGARQAMALLSLRGPVAQPEARELYYRVTGRAFDRDPAPARWRTPAVTSGHPVQLAASRIDGSVDAHSAVGYFEWTMVFRNSSRMQQEARLEMALPKSAVVSRATLWIHGGEREAAFGERGQVRQAYESVVRVRRDPLLVTSSGPDRVLVQCFPIEPAGEMKIRIGITAPVSPEGLIALPLLVSRNFDAAEPSSIWVESKSAMASASRREDGVYVMRGELPERQRTTVQLSGMRLGSTWAQESQERVVEQRFVERIVQPPRRLIVVVDGSESMRPMRDEIRAALAGLPKTIDARVVVAARSGVRDMASATDWRGGVDAVPALEQALPTAVLWIAGEQPVKLAGTERIRQALERGGGATRLTVLAGDGGNVILRDLEGLPGVETIPRVGTVAQDLRRFIAGWRTPEPQRIVERRIVAADAVAKDSEPGSPHIVRLWAAEEAAVLAPRHRADAVALAVAHQIVTPLSGAVVLETAAQYAQNHLQPGSSSTVPTMPEPETWGMIAIGLAMLAWGWRRRYATAA